MLIRTAIADVSCLESRLTYTRQHDTTSCILSQSDTWRSALSIDAGYLRWRHDNNLAAGISKFDAALPSVVEKTEPGAKIMVKDFPGILMK